MSAPKKQIIKPTPIGGFPEWLPEYRAVEQQWFDHLRRVFESYGYCSIETPSVEALDILTAKGEIDKEIFTLGRLHADEADKDTARLALHFDQTVPMARYVAQHFNALDFPFKRYQTQKVWRGERPQVGRLREFYQCDIDVIHVDNLPLHFDAEMPSVMYEALMGLNIGRVQIRVSNRKIILGFLAGLGVEDTTAVLQAIDKIEKISAADLRGLLHQIKGMTAENMDAVLKLAQVKGDAAAVRALQPNSDTMREGIEELAFVMDALKPIVAKGGAIADLSIVRGLDYYTGTVYETALLDVPQFTGSVCSGGRYDDLAGNYIAKHLPGVGISIGFTRLFHVLSHYGLLKPGKKCPTDVLVVLPNEDRRQLALETAATLRARGLKVECYHAPQKLQKQLAYAEKKGIPFVWFPPFEDGNPHEVKNMATGTQEKADLNSWSV